VQPFLRRLEQGERWWGAECACRGVGAVLLGVCAAALWWLHRSLNQAGVAHGPGPLEIAFAAVAVAALGPGLAFVFEGPALFRLIAAPGHHLTFTP
jgi:apolipoprotein N-acyltransferase